MWGKLRGLKNELENEVKKYIVVVKQEYQEDVRAHHFLITSLWGRGRGFTSLSGNKLLLQRMRSFSSSSTFPV